MEALDSNCWSATRQINRRNLSSVSQRWAGFSLLCLPNISPGVCKHSNTAHGTPIKSSVIEYKHIFLCQEAIYPIRPCLYVYLKTWVFAHTQASHPHVGQQHLTAGVSDEISVLGGYRQLQAGGVAPVLQLVCEQLHGHLLVLFVGLVQEFHRQLAKFPAKWSAMYIQYAGADWDINRGKNAGNKLNHDFTGCGIIPDHLARFSWSNLHANTVIGKRRQDILHANTSQGGVGVLHDKCIKGRSWQWQINSANYHWWSHLYLFHALLTACQETSQLLHNEY